MIKRSTWLGVFAALAVIVTASIGGSTQASAMWQPGPVQSWQWQLTWPVDTTKNVQVYDIDYHGSESATPTQVKNLVTTLHNKGKKVICYLETGGWEDYRPDAGDYAASIKGNAIDGWAGEKYVDIRQWDTVTGPTGKTLQQILVKRFQDCKDAGFDGVETDIDDSYSENTGFPLTQADQILFNQRVAAEIHNLDMAWFLKNGTYADTLAESATFINTMEPLAQGTVNEQCWQYTTTSNNTCGLLKPFVNAGKPILNAEYTGQKATVCPKALAFPMATMRKSLSLNANISWYCW